MREPARRAACLAGLVLVLAGKFAARGAAEPLAARGAAEPLAALACAKPKLPPQILSGRSAAAPQPPLPAVRLRTRTASLLLAVAADAASRERGLMCVTGLRPHGGMIFAFPETNDYEFWMKNTLVPLDMIWVESDGRVNAVAANVPAVTSVTPDERLPRRHGHGRYVIELRAGEAARDGIRAGGRLALPTLPSPPP